MGRAEDFRHRAGKADQAAVKAAAKTHDPEIIWTFRNIAAAYRELADLIERNGFDMGERRQEHY